ncbi:MAG: hypothetical protein FWG19_00545 [Methanomassiliicoccaceae archaeon]|nr:hypothetical protein [Methanomassiliicoccaceae archaeon]
MTMTTTKTPTLEDLAKRVEALEKENKELRAMLSAGGGGRGGGRSRYRTRRSADGKEHVQDDSISNEAVSDVLGGFIENFNEKAEKKQSPVGYMISNMEIELKTQVIKDGDELILVPVDPDSSPESVSTVKMEVRAVPGNAGPPGAAAGRGRRE